MNGLVIRLLGSPHIELEGTPAALETRKATALLAYPGVSRKTLSLLLNGHAGISPETLAPTLSAGVAVRLSKAFGRTPEGWMRLQMQFDLAQISRRADDIRVTSFVAPTTEHDRRGHRIT